MTDFQKLLDSDFTFTFKVLKSKDRVIILPPISKLGIKLTAINVYENELRKTDFVITESNGKLIFQNLNNDTILGFDIDELNLGRIYFRYESGHYETFEVKELESSGDLQLHLR